MFEAYSSAMAILFQPINLLILVLAVIIGLIVGVIPTIGGIVMMSLLLPFVFRMPVEVALILLIALHSVVHTSGGITAILLNIPGTGPNAATMLDGFPMNQRGEGARAIGAAVSSSMFGGLLPVFFALAMVPLILPLILAFGQPEMAILVLLGISFLATLSGGSITKGIISGMVGLLISFVGYHSITGVHRFSFGTTFLYDGIELVPLALGLFGLSELFHMAIKGQDTIAQKVVLTKLSGVFQGMKDVWRHKWLWFRSTIIGYFIGIIPGIGAELATWVCYGQARQTSKNPDEFGTGRVEGIIAPEAANNAKEAGALLTTMSLGIPGSAGMAVLLAAFFMVGVTPGPQMLADHLPLALALLLGIALANIIGGGISLLSTPYLVRVSSVNLDFLFPGVLVIAMAGIYVATLSVLNLVVALAFGLLGLVMRKYGYSEYAIKKIKDKLKNESLEAEIEYITEAGVFGSALGGSAPISVEIKGDEMEDLIQISKEVVKALESVEDIYGVKNSFKGYRPEIRIKVNKDRASLYDISTQNVTITAQTAIKGYVATQLKEAGNPLYLIGYREIRPAPAGLRSNLPIRSRTAAPHHRHPSSPRQRPQAIRCKGCAGPRAAVHPAPGPDAPSSPGRPPCRSGRSFPTPPNSR